MLKFILKDTNGNVLYQRIDNDSFFLTYKEKQILKEAMKNRNDYEVEFEAKRDTDNPYDFLKMMNEASMNVSLRAGQHCDDILKCWHTASDMSDTGRCDAFVECDESDESDESAEFSECDEFVSFFKSFKTSESSESDEKSMFDEFMSQYDKGRSNIIYPDTSASYSSYAIMTPLEFVKAYNEINDKDKLVDDYFKHLGFE